MTKKMTTGRFRVLLNALSRAADEWEAELDLAEEQEDRGLAAELRSDLDALGSARQVLVERFATQFQQLNYPIPDGLCGQDGCVFLKLHEGSHSHER